MKPDQTATEFGRKQAVATLREAADCTDNRLSHRLLDTVERELGKTTRLRVVEPNESAPTSTPPTNRALWAAVVGLALVIIGEKLWPLLDKVPMLFP